MKSYRLMQSKNLTVRTGAAAGALGFTSNVADSRNALRCGPLAVFYNTVP